jgi:hypothetical protein
MKPTSEEVINELCKILDATPKKINGFMTAKEKAKKLLGKYLTYFPVFRNEKEYSFEYDYDEDKAKECALIAVDEVIDCCKQYDELNETYVTQIDYWMEVKREIMHL